MEEMQNIPTMPGQKPAGKMGLILAIIIVIILAVVIWMFPSGSNEKTPAPLGEESATTTVEMQNDTTEAINQELESIDLGDLNKEFESIDVDLQNL